MNEVSQLKVRVAELESRLAALEQKPAQTKPAPPATPRQEEGVRIFYPPEQTGFIEPSAEQLRQLLALIYVKWPTLAPPPR
jgi:hypothetical protein